MWVGWTCMGGWQRWLRERRWLQRGGPAGGDATTQSIRQCLYNAMANSCRRSQRSSSSLQRKFVSDMQHNEAHVADTDDLSQSIAMFRVRGL